MTMALESRNGFTRGKAMLGLRRDQVGSVRQQVHDGDTIHVQLSGNLGIRFLGVDAPEISFILPDRDTFTWLSNDRWEVFLSDPFAAELPPFEPALSQGLRDYLAQRLGPGTASNHDFHAKVAEDALEEAVEQDMQVLGQTKEELGFFLAFAHEVMDRYGRLLCYINRYQDDAMLPSPRPLSYNERLLQAGVVCPYFIWPNLNPFRNKGSLLAAVIPPGTANDVANAEASLRSAREAVRQARQQQVGIFDAHNPLRLAPFELRFLARRQPPDRWVIDLSKNNCVLIRPQEYYTIPCAEDRLFIPPEYVPLFIQAGWQKACPPLN